MSATEQASTYLTRTGKRHTRSGRECVTDCPKCGKEKHCYVNDATFLWHCKVCDAKGNEHTFKTLHGDAVEIGTLDTTEDAHAAKRRQDDLAAAKMFVSRKGEVDVDRWARELQTHTLAQPARDLLARRGIRLDVCAELKIGWKPATQDGTETERSEGGSRGGSMVARRRAKAQPTPKATQGADGLPSAPQGHLGYITIPAFKVSPQGEEPTRENPSMVKLRLVNPVKAKYERIAGGESTLYAPLGFDPKEPVLIVGGELDAVAVTQAGFMNVVASTVGETQWSDSFTETLSACEDIVLVYDNDEAGRKGAREVATRLGEHRCRIGMWPEGVNDANDAMLALGERWTADFIRGLIERSEPIGTQQIARIGAFRDRIKADLFSPNASRGKGWPWGLAALDDLLVCCRPGEVTVFFGLEKSGKSTLTSQLAIMQAQAGRGVLYWAAEMGPKRQALKWVRQQGRMSPEEMNTQTVDRVFDQLTMMPLWIVEHYGTCPQERLRNTIMHAVDRLGVRFVVVDHLHFLVSEGASEREEIRQILSTLTEIAQKKEVHIALVAHVSNIDSGKHAKDRDGIVPELRDLKGSSSIKQMLDNGIAIWRPRDAQRNQQRVNGKCPAVLFVKAARDDDAREGSAPLLFDDRAAWFSDCDDDVLIKSSQGKEKQEVIDVDFEGI